MIVSKFGGSSLESIDKIKKTAEFLLNYKGKQIVVVSAMGKTTNNLFSDAYLLTKKPTESELAKLITTGEAISSSLLSIAINSLGGKSISLNSYQAGINAYGNDYLNSYIKGIKKDVINHYLKDYDIVVITGYQAVNEKGDVVALGRGGSDTTAVALASVFNAPCYIYTDVAYVYTIDPRIVENAKKYERLKYDEMVELASLGSGVLIARSVILGEEYNVELHLCYSLEKGGTTIVNNKTTENMEICGISCRKNLRLLKRNRRDLKNLVDDSLKNNYRIEMFGIVENELLCVIQTSNDNLEIGDFTTVDRISLVGKGLVSNEDILKKLLVLFEKIDFEPILLSTSEYYISFVAKSSQAGSIIRNLGKEFGLLKEHM